MVKIVVGFVLLGMLSVISATNIEGFRNIKWGDSSSKLNNKQLLSQEGKKTNYIVLNDSLLIGSAKVNKIIYNFYKNRFYSTTISFDNRDDLNELIFSITGKYNLHFPCQTQPHFVFCYANDGNGHNVDIEYKDSDGSGKGRLRFYDNKIFEELGNEAELQQRESIKGF